MRMTNKKRKHLMGRAVRRYTGLPFVDAMRVGRAMVNYDLFLTQELPFVEVKEVGTCSCCMSWDYFAHGPKESLNMSECLRGERPHGFEWPA